MKTRLLLFFAFMMILAANANAQDQTVPVGKTKNYGAVGTASGNTYLWTVTDASGASITAPAAATTDIKWLKPGTYTLTFKETNPLSTTCFQTITKSILVVGNTLTMAPAPASVCAPITGNSTVTFVVNRAGGENAVTVNYSYTVNGGTATTGSVTVVALATTQNIALTIANPTDGTTDNVIDLTITSAVDADGNTIDVTALTPQQTTLFATPITTDIQFN